MRIGTAPCIAGTHLEVLLLPACALIALWLIYLKNKGYLEYANQEHLHDMGIFMFAFSIFWTYLWFAQYMLIGMEIFLKKPFILSIVYRVHGKAYSL